MFVYPLFKLRNFENFPEDNNKDAHVYVYMVFSHQGDGIYTNDVSDCCISRERAMRRPE